MVFKLTKQWMRYCPVMPLPLGAGDGGAREGNSHQLKVSYAAGTLYNGLHGLNSIGHFTSFYDLMYCL